MEEIKSKLCSDCAQSAELGPPSKQSACRAKHEFSDACPRKGIMISKVSLLKRAPLVVNDDEASPSLYLRPLPLKKEEDSKFGNGPRKCTMLTAREMAELVHGKGNADPKLSQVGVTRKVSSWIQKQKDKRKAVFFIGDTPSFFIENSSSERTTSLSSAGVKSSSNSEEVFLKPNEHKGLFIKRTSSNRGSTRRKDRQGSPAPEEREFIKVFNCDWNQVDRCVASWNSRTKNCSHNLSNNESDKKDTAQYLDFQQRKKIPEFQVTTPQLGGASF
ncbi:uncharacterized protein TNCV_3380941 [Trichonephila clavipes]|nr:uncharacterized protein TNCV_3380941 [Trichonephila clavipes]